MPTRLRMAALCLLALAGPAAAQVPDPAPVPGGPGELLTTPPGLRPPPVVSGDGPPAEEGDIRADLILGLPTAVRLQARVFHTRLWAEAGGGLYVIFPGAFVGLRVDAPAYRGGRHCLTFRPGVTAWYVPAGDLGGGGWFGGEYRDFGVFSVDTDAIWKHRWTGRFHTQLGLKVGVGLAVSGRGVLPLPHLGLLVGCEY